MIDISKNIVERTEAAIRGDTVQMGIVFEWYRPKLYANALKICGNTPLAKDALQDTFISAFTHISSLNDTTAFYPWIKRILVNACYLLLRKEKSLLNQLNSLHADPVIQDSIDLHFEKIANQQQMYDALAHLSVELRSCVMLRYFSNFNSYDDIALIMGIPVGTVRSRLSAAREKLALLYMSHGDTNDKVLNKSRHWSGYYLHLWGNMYDDFEIRNEFFDHLQPALDIRYTSGQNGKGRKFVENEINDDFFYGTRFNVAEVSSCGNISVIEGMNFNPVEHPDRCPSSTVFVAIREKDKIDLIHIFNSPRLIKE